MVNFELGGQGDSSKSLFFPLFMGKPSQRQARNTNNMARENNTANGRGRGDSIGEPLVLRGKINFPPLHIKEKQYVKHLDKEENSFRYKCTGSPGFSKEELKVGIFYFLK